MTEATQTNGGSRDDPTGRRVEEGPRGGAHTWYEVLDVKSDATADEIRVAYDRALALVEGRSIGGYLMLDPLAAESARVDVEAAYRVLSSSEARATYDRTLGDTEVSTPNAVPPLRMPEPTRSDDTETQDARALLAIEADQKGESKAPAVAASDVPTRTETPSSPGLRFLAPQPDEAREHAPPAETAPPRLALKFEEPAERPAEPAASWVGPAPESANPAAKLPLAEPSPLEASPTAPPDATMPAPSLPPSATTSPPGALPEGEINGIAVRQLREARGLTIEELADLTKIRKQYLKAIEEQDVPNLPARVYLRGFLTQVGRVLKVDRTRLAEGYLSFISRCGTGAEEKRTD